MKLQYCESGAQPRIIIGINELIIRDKVVDIIHSKHMIECKVSVNDASLMYIESDDIMLMKITNISGEELEDEISDVVIRFKEEKIILDEITLDNVYSIQFIDSI